MIKFRITISQVVEVILDDTKFTQDWLSEWRSSFYRFDTVREHAEHIAQLEARGALDPHFTEGYGPLKDMKISAIVISQDADINEEICF